MKYWQLFVISICQKGFRILILALCSYIKVSKSHYISGVIPPSSNRVKRIQRCKKCKNYNNHSTLTSYYDAYWLVHIFRVLKKCFTNKLLSLLITESHPPTLTNFFSIAFIIAVCWPWLPKEEKNEDWLQEKQKRSSSFLSWRILFLFW